MPKRPLKPDRPISSIVFPKEGRPHLEIERLPRTQEDLECAIGRKFLGALAHFRAEQYLDLRRGSEPAGLICRHQDGSDVSIQVVEVVDQNLQLLQTMRSSYAAAIEAQHQHLLAAFRGCSVTVVDSGESPYLPPVRTTGGRTCLSELVKGLEIIGSDIASLQVRKIRSRRLQIGPHKGNVHIMCERFASGQADEPFSFRWSGGGPVYSSDQPRRILSAAVENKISKWYAKPRGVFWLLAYSTDTLLMPDDPDLLRARQALARGAHVFDGAWFLSPYNNKDLGHLLKIWPLDEHATPV